MFFGHFTHLLQNQRWLLWAFVLYGFEELHADLLHNGIILVRWY